MKFISFAMFDVAKAAEVAQAGDKVANTPGQKIIGQYICQGKAFDGIPPNTMVVIAIHETESNEAITTGQYAHDACRGNHVGRACTGDASGWRSSNRKEIQKVILTRS